MKIPGGRDLDISIEPLSQIKPHEDTIPFLLDAITSDMKRTEYQRDPILIDGKTRIALDGTHRLRALKTFRAKYALCSEFDYFDQSVKLERWLRYIIAPSRELISMITSVFHMKRCTDLKKAMSEVDSGTKGLALLSTTESFVSDDEPETIEIYQKLRKVYKLCEQEKLDVQFATESEKYDLFSSESVHVFYPMRLSKRDVVQMAKRHEVFPYKTTRHIVPIRPMGIYFPIKYLKNSTLAECSAKLDQIVKFSKVNLKRRNAWYEGRRYSEQLAVFKRIS